MRACHDANEFNGTYTNHMNIHEYSKTINSTTVPIEHKPTYYRRTNHTSFKVYCHT